MLGTTVGPYRILGQLGAGGMGVVYKALDIRLQRHVALKVLPEAVSRDEERRRRFLQEARAASALNDPHIITVHDVLEHAGTEFLVMELVEGCTLRELSQQQLSVEQVVDYVTQIAHALSVAHSARIIHRDLKPDNIMVTDRGIVKVLDFGIAKLAAGGGDVTTGQLTRDGDVIGTAEYMSPEQARGGPVDHRTDIFSLGAILYELAGRIQSAPAGLVAVAKQALERDPWQRHASMLEFAAAVSSAKTATPEWRRSAAIAGSVLAAGLLVLILMWRPARDLVKQVLDVTRPAGTPQAVITAKPASALEHTQQALALLRRFDQAGNIDNAITSFEAAIAIDKNYAPAWAGLAHAYWRQRMATRDNVWGARAEDAARQAVALNAYLADGHVALGLSELVTGRAEEARYALAHALILDPGNAAAHRGLGDLAHRADRLDDARSHYLAALERDPSNWELPRLLGDLRYASGNYKEALDWYEKSAAAAPDSAVPYRLIGAASHMSGDYARAATAFQRSLTIQPTAAGYTNLGTALFYQGRYRESLPAFERARDMTPANPLTWANVGDAYRWVPGNRDKSQEAYARAVQLLRAELQKDGNNVAYRSRLALYLAKQGDPVAAAAELNQVLGPTVKEVTAWYRGAVTYEIIGNRAAAIAALQTALTRGYSLTEVKMDPELASLRGDVAYHRLIARFEQK